MNYQYKPTTLYRVSAKGSRNPICKVLECVKMAQSGGICVAHGCKLKSCKVDGCNKNIVRGGVCVKHGAPMKRCNADGCQKQAVNKGGLCLSWCDTKTVQDRRM